MVEAIVTIDIDGHVLRHCRTGDVDAFARHANNPALFAQVSDRFPHPFTRDDAEAWIERCRDIDRGSILAICSPDELIGTVGLEFHEDVHRRTAQIGYWIGEPFWGLGIATKALRAFTEHAFANFDIDRLEAFVYETNPASARVLEKAGYTCEGRLRKRVFKLGKVIDESIWSRLRSEE
jgi:RimJ/RimL family protein N-acetyltransferase